MSLTRRSFVGALGLAALRPPTDLLALEPLPTFPPAPEDEYDLLAKLHYNENPYGPPESVRLAMNKAYKYANRYGYPDGGIVVDDVGTYTADQFARGLMRGDRRLTLEELRRRMAPRVARLGA